jgi:hypothetical protein
MLLLVKLGGKVAKNHAWGAFLYNLKSAYHSSSGKFKSLFVMRKTEVEFMFLKNFKIQSSQPMQKKKQSKKRLKRLWPTSLKRQ